MSGRNISTMVFMDTEATGVPEEENNEARLTEISMIAVKSSHILSAKKGETPRVQQKLTLCLNPRRPIRAVASSMSGLTNNLLENETYFNEEVAHVLISFLKTLQTPVCLVSHFGTGLDFPVLKTHLNELNEAFPVDLLYTDSVNAFSSLVTCSSKKFSVICKQLLGEDVVTHRAEDDCVALLKCAVALGPKFIRWVNQHSYPFEEIKAMKKGVSVLQTRRRYF